MMYFTTVNEGTFIDQDWRVKLGKTATIHQVTTMLATSKHVLFVGYNHPTNRRYWWPDTSIITRVPARVIIKVSGHQYQWLAGGYDLKIGHS